MEMSVKMFISKIYEARQRRWGSVSSAVKPKSSQEQAGAKKVRQKNTYRLTAA